MPIIPEVTASTLQLLAEVLALPLNESWVTKSYTDVRSVSYKFR